MTALLAALLLAASPTAPASPEGAASPASPAAPDAGHQKATELARKVQAYYEATRDLEAKFQQTYTYAGFGRRQVSSGTLRVKKPGMMRWDYEKPSTKTIAVKGARLVQFEPEERQAYVDEKFDASAMSAAVTFLLGKGDLAREFKLSTGEGGALVLHPKDPDPRVESIALSVGPSGEVTATRVTDGSGNVNEVKLTNVRRNPGLPDSAFDVKLPKDVRRVDGAGR